MDIGCVWCPYILPLSCVKEERECVHSERQPPDFLVVHTSAENAIPYRYIEREGGRREEEEDQVKPELIWRVNTAKLFEGLQRKKRRGLCVITRSVVWEKTALYYMLYPQNAE